MDRASHGLSLIEYFEQHFCTGKLCIDLPQNICSGGGIPYNSVLPKPLFWFRSDTDIQTQNGRYFQADTLTSWIHISKGET